MWLSLYSGMGYFVRKSVYCKLAEDYIVCCTLILDGKRMFDESLSVWVKAGRFRTLLTARFLAIVSGCLAANLCCTTAHAQLDYRVLREPALVAKTPERDFLEVVTRAGDRLIAVGEHGIIIYSDDNGHDWHQAAVPVDVTLTTIAFATPQDGWAGGALGVILHTTDGGVTWKIQITGIRVNQLIATAASQLAASNPTDLITQRALRRANIFMEEGPDKPFLSILPFDANNVQIFGAYRMCIKSNNAGKTWKDCSLDIPDPVSHNLYQAVRSGSSIYVAGESGSVFRSDDQGQTFTQLTAPADDTLFGLIVTPSHTLLSFGVAGGLFRSLDQGKTWSSVTIGNQSNLTAGVVLKSGLILVLSEGGAVYLSSDDGASFHVLKVNEGMDLFSAAQAPNGDIVLVGSGGVRVLSPASLT